MGGSGHGSGGLRWQCRDAVDDQRWREHSHAFDLHIAVLELPLVVASGGAAPSRRWTESVLGKILDRSAPTSDSRSGGVISPANEMRRGLKCSGSLLL